MMIRKWTKWNKLKKQTTPSEVFYGMIMVWCLTPLCEFESRSGEVYSIQHYVIKFVSDLPQVGGFLRELRFSPPIKLTATI
jgi:hypothetical protein